MEKRFIKVIQSYNPNDENIGDHQADDVSSDTQVELIPIENLKKIYRFIDFQHWVIAYTFDDPVTHRERTFYEIKSSYGDYDRKFKELTEMLCKV